MKYLLDTNTVIYYLQDQFPESPRLFVRKVITQAAPAISIITEMELMS